MFPQGRNGGWGRTPLAYDSSFYPLFPVLQALALSKQDMSDQYRKAVQFIINKQNIDGSFAKESRHDLPSRELRTALALNALLVAPVDLDRRSIDKGIDWLLKKQRADGSWNGRFYPGLKNEKKEDIFATAMALLALHNY